MPGIRATQCKSVIVVFKRHLLKKNSVLKYSWFTGLRGKESTSNAGDTEDLVRSLGREDPLEEDMAIHSSILAREIPWTEEPGSYSPWGRKESDTTEGA